MLKSFQTRLAVGLAMLCPYATSAQSPTPKMPVGTQVMSLCDLNNDGVVNLLDMQVAVNIATGQTTCTAGVISAGVCNITLVQRVTNAALTGNCITGVTVHSVTLTWTASSSTNVAGYNVYRGTQASGPYTKINAFPVAATSYADTAAQAGATYYYVTTAVDNNNNESAYSNQAQAVIPYP